MKVPRSFRIFVPDFAPNFAPNFPRGKRRPEKIHQKSPLFFNAKFPGKYEKMIHQNFLESRQSNTFQQVLKAFHRPKFAPKKVFCCTARLCKGSHTNLGDQDDRTTRSLVRNQVSTTFCFSTPFWSFPPKTPLHLGIENSHKRVP